MSSKYKTAAERKKIAEDLMRSGMGLSSGQSKIRAALIDKALNEPEASQTQRTPKKVLKEKKKKEPYEDKPDYGAFS